MTKATHDHVEFSVLLLSGLSDHKSWLCWMEAQSFQKRADKLAVTYLTNTLPLSWPLQDLLWTHFKHFISPGSLGTRPVIFPMWILFFSPFPLLEGTARSYLCTSHWLSGPWEHWRALMVFISLAWSLLPQSLREGHGATFRHSPELSVLAQAMLQEYCSTTAVPACGPWSDLPVWLWIYFLTRELPGNHWTVDSQESWTWPWLMDWLLDLTLVLPHCCELTGWSRLMVECSCHLGLVCSPWLGTKLLVRGSVSSSAAGWAPFGSSWHLLLTAGTALLVWSCSQLLQKFRQSKIWWQWNWRKTWKKILRNNLELWLSHQPCCKTEMLYLVLLILHAMSCLVGALNFVDCPRFIHLFLEIHLLCHHLILFPE